MVKMIVRPSSASDLRKVMTDAARKASSPLVGCKRNVSRCRDQESQLQDEPHPAIVYEDLSESVPQRYSSFLAATDTFPQLIAHWPVGTGFESHFE